MNKRDLKMNLVKVIVCLVEIQAQALPTRVTSVPQRESHLLLNTCRVPAPGSHCGPWRRDHGAAGHHTWPGQVVDSRPCREPLALWSASQDGPEGQHLQWPAGLRGNSVDIRFSPYFVHLFAVETLLLPLFISTLGFNGSSRVKK